MIKIRLVRNLFLQLSFPAHRKCQFKENDFKWVKNCIIHPSHNFNSLVYSKSPRYRRTSNVVYDELALEWMWMEFVVWYIPYLRESKVVLMPKTQPDHLEHLYKGMCRTMSIRFEVREWFLQHHFLSTHCMTLNDLVR